jgi:7-cyano-7-deazaguanine synthase in queuosine biosynthesis
MLKVSELFSDKSINPVRFYSLRNNILTHRQYFAIPEYHQDLLNLLMTLTYVETQKPSTRNIELETKYKSQFNILKSEIELLYNVLTNRQIEIKVKAGKSSGSYLSLESNELDSILLLSGGIDSIAGGVLYSDTPRLSFLHINSNKEVFGKVRKLMQITPLNNNSIHYIDTKIKGISQNRSAFSNTRGLLFLGASAILLNFYGGTSVKFCENGSQMMDVMLGSDVYSSSRSTKNTNLKYLSLVESFIKKIFPSFKIEYPFLHSTKAEMIVKHLSGDLIAHSWSCYNMYNSQMCGSCWNCFITKMSLLAAGFPSGYMKTRQNVFVDIIDDAIYISNQNIILDMLRFYYDLLHSEAYAIEIISNFNSYNNNVIDLMQRFALDLYLGVGKSLNSLSSLNEFGKTIQSFYLQIDQNELNNRAHYLRSLRK